MKPLTEQEVRDIVRDEMQKNYMSGSPNIPPHSHNGTDGLNIAPVDLIGFSPIPSSFQKFQNPDGSSEYGYGSPAKLVSGDGTHFAQYINDQNTAVYPIPIVVGNGVGVQGAFEGGYAPEGTMVLFAGIAQPILYIRFDGGWYGVVLTLTA